MMPNSFQNGEIPSRVTKTFMVPTVLRPPRRPMSISAINAGMATTTKAMKYKETNSPPPFAPAR